MTCDELLKALGEYVDDETVVSLYKEFGDHLAGCNPCTLVVDNIRKTISLFKAGEPYPMPPDFTNSLKSALKKKWAEKFPAKPA